MDTPTNNGKEQVLTTLVFGHETDFVVREQYSSGKVSVTVTTAMPRLVWDGKDGHTLWSFIPPRYQGNGQWK